MKNINNDIKTGEFKKAYLLYGPEDFLKRMYKNKLKEAISGDDTMNFSYYEGKDIDINDIRSISGTLPFFAERRLILIENSGMFKTSSEDMNDIVKNAPEFTYFVFCESEIDKRNRLFKTVSDLGYACEMKTQTDEALLTWTRRFFTQDNKNISREDLEFFLAGTGSDMDNIYNETMKLLSYAKDREVITRDDIEQVCTTQISDKVFEMIDAMAGGRTDTVMRLYSDLLALKVPPMKILALVGRQFSQLMAVRKLMDSGMNSQNIAARLGIRPYFISKNIAQAKGYSFEMLESAVNDCVETEALVKTGQLEEKYGVELLIIKYSL